VLAESGSVCSDPVGKSVSFAKRVVFLDELVGVTVVALLC